MELWDEHTFKRIQVKYWLHDETGLPQIRLTAHQENRSLHMDGIHFKKYIKFLSTSDIGELVRKSGHSTENGFSIDSDYMMSKTIEENSNVEIDRDNYSYLYIDEEIVPFTIRRFPSFLITAPMLLCMLPTSFLPLRAAR